MRQALLLVCLAAVGCFGVPKEPESFALGLVDAARDSTLAGEWFDDALADRLRRVQLWKRVPSDHASPALLAALVAGDPEAATPLPERERVHRARAAHNLRAALGGACRVRHDDELERARLGLFTAATPNAPAAAQAELTALAARLQHAVVVRVECDRGTVAMTLVPEDHWRAVDLFAPPTAELAALPLAAR